MICSHLLHNYHNLTIFNFRQVSGFLSASCSANAGTFLTALWINVWCLHCAVQLSQLGSFMFFFKTVPVINQMSFKICLYQINIRIYIYTYNKISYDISSTGGPPIPNPGLRGLIWQWEFQQNFWSFGTSSIGVTCLHDMVWCTTGLPMEIGMDHVSCFWSNWLISVHATRKIQRPSLSAALSTNSTVALPTWSQRSSCWRPAGAKSKAFPYDDDGYVGRHMRAKSDV